MLYENNLIGQSESSIPEHQGMECPNGTFMACFNQTQYSHFNGAVSPKGIVMV